MPYNPLLHVYLLQGAKMGFFYLIKKRNNNRIKKPAKI